MRRDEHRLTVYLVWIRFISREEALHEHVETGYTKSFRSTEGLVGGRLMVFPRRASARIKEYGDQEEVN